MSRTLAQRYQLALDPATVRQILDALDEACLLENERSAQALARKIADYRALPARPTSHAGLAYPDAPGTLAPLLDGYLTAPIGPRGVDDRGRRNGFAMRQEVAARDFYPLGDPTWQGALLKAG